MTRYRGNRAAAGPANKVRFQDGQVAAAAEKATCGGQKGGQVQKGLQLSQGISETEDSGDQQFPNRA